MRRLLRLALIVVGLAAVVYGTASLTGGWLGTPPWWDPAPIGRMTPTEVRQAIWQRTPEERRRLDEANAEHTGLPQTAAEGDEFFRRLRREGAAIRAGAPLPEAKVSEEPYALEYRMSLGRLSDLKTSRPNRPRAGVGLCILGLGLVGLGALLPRRRGVPAT